MRYYIAAAFIGGIVLGAWVDPTTIGETLIIGAIAGVIFAGLVYGLEKK